MPALSVPPCLAARGRWRRTKPAPFWVNVVFIQFGAGFEDISQSGKDGLVGAAGCFVDTFPLARSRLPRKAADKAGGQYAARQVPFRRVARKPSREIAADRRDCRACDMGIRTGPEDFADDHRNLSRLNLSSDPGSIFIAIEFVLNVSLLKKILSSLQSQRLDSPMSTICHIAILHRNTKSGLLFSYPDSRSRKCVLRNPGCLIERSFFASNCHKPGVVQPSMRIRKWRGRRESA
jgi:hypothetical protein